MTATPVVPILVGDNRLSENIIPISIEQYFLNFYIYKKRQKGLSGIRKSPEDQPQPRPCPYRFGPGSARTKKRCPESPVPF